MAKSFTILEKRMSEGARARSDEKARRLVAEMPLNEIRAARELTHEHLAKVLHIKQASFQSWNGGRTCT